MSTENLSADGAVGVDPAQINIHDSWKSVLQAEFSQPYFVQVKATLLAAKQAGQVVFPPGKMIFNAFNRTPFDQVKVVIIGQDPYHKPNQAMGLSFSVPPGIRVPPSLINIYKELERTIPGFQRPGHGDLTAWADQGVLLLNASLTVEQGNAGSHSKIGWQQFTDAVIQEISDQKSNVVFLLWGNFAKKKAELINADKHHVLTAVHPSPLAGGAFIGCDHFAKCNKLLENNGFSPINWQN